jgi:hypothetical protein
MNRLGVLLWCLAARTDNFDDHAVLKASFQSPLPMRP